MLENVPDWILWALLIFAAGVVGQFGKSLTLKVLDFFTGAEETSARSQSTGNSAKQETALDVKETKKAKKAEVKRAKKEAKGQAKLKG